MCYCLIRQWKIAKFKTTSGIHRICICSIWEKVVTLIENTGVLLGLTDICGEGVGLIKLQIWQASLKYNHYDLFKIP